MIYEAEEVKLYFEPDTGKFYISFMGIPWEVEMKLIPKDAEKIRKLKTRDEKIDKIFGLFEPESLESNTVAIENTKDTYTSN